ncbi:MAG: nucleoside-diphosphate kinase [Candidatus Nanoarchaeia archaeon]|nr:nucleoside-diphosphate kinase [Candidatus Nanoarchaeia archaeon]
MIERTLVLIKPDGVQRSLVGEIISRFERIGLKILGMKFIHVTKDFAEKHYTEDIAKRRGENVRNWLLEFITEGPVVALCLEGVEAIEIVRKMVGGTEPKSAAPGTIRGDYSHVSYSYADKNNIPIRNLIHASGDKKDAEKEVPLWFSEAELFEYEVSHEKHIR